MNVAELMERLFTYSMKLYSTCDKKAHAVANPTLYTKEDLLSILETDIRLCKQRGLTKQAIEAALNKAILDGHMNVIDEVKRYG